MICSIRTCFMVTWRCRCVRPPSFAHSRAAVRSHTHTHFKRSDDAQDAHGPSKQTLLDNFIRTSQSLYPPNIICSPVSDTHPPSCPESPIVAVCVLVARSWMKERSPCGLLPSDPLLSMKQEIMAEGPRCKRRKQANPRRKNGKKVSCVEKLVLASLKHSWIWVRLCVVNWSAVQKSAENSATV